MTGGLCRCLFPAHVSESEAKQEVVDAGLRRHEDVFRMLVVRRNAVAAGGEVRDVAFVMPAKAGIHDFFRGEPVKEKGGWVYIITNRPNGILYIGVTSDLVRRIAEHRAGEVAGFAQRYGLKRLVWFERHEEILAAIAREKAMKEWQRAWKVRLIMVGNPAWDDLYDGIL